MYSETSCPRALGSGTFPPHSRLPLFQEEAVRKQQNLEETSRQLQEADQAEFDASNQDLAEEAYK